MDQQHIWFERGLAPLQYVHAAGIRRCFERCLFSAATFEPIQLYIICLTANQ